jgi:hypothetical protein
MKPQAMSLKQFCDLSHVGVVAANTGHGEVDQLLDRAGIQRNAAGGSTLHCRRTYSSVHRFDRQLPERFAERCKAPFGLVTSSHPAHLPDIAINLFCHAKYNRDPANMWLRQIFVELFADNKTK